MGPGKYFPGGADDALSSDKGFGTKRRLVRIGIGLSQEELGTIVEGCVVRTHAVTDTTGTDNRHLVVDGTIVVTTGSLSVGFGVGPQGRNDFPGLYHGRYESVGEGELHYCGVDGREFGRLVGEPRPEFRSGQIPQFVRRGRSNFLIALEECLLHGLACLVRDEITRSEALTASAHIVRIVEVDGVELIGVVPGLESHILPDALYHGIGGSVIPLRVLVHEGSSGKDAVDGHDGCESPGLEDGMEKGRRHERTNKEKLLASLRRIPRLGHGHFVVIHQHGEKEPESGILVVGKETHKGNGKNGKWFWRFAILC